MRKALLTGLAVLVGLSLVVGHHFMGRRKKAVYTLKMSTQLADTSPMVQGFRAWAEAVRAKTGGKVEIEIYTAAQLGSDEEMIERAISGENAAVLTDGGRMAKYVNEAGIIGMPYIVNNYDELRALTESPTFASWDVRFAACGIHILAYNWYDGPRNFYANRKIYTPSDLSGLRIRTPVAPVWSLSVAAMGAIPVDMGWNDAYYALKVGKIDGVEVQTTSAFPARIWEVAEYAARTEHFQLANFIMAGTKWWNTLPEDLREIVEIECRAQAAINAHLVLQTASEWEAKMAEQGLTFTSPDKAAFITASQASYEELGFTSLRDQLWAEIGKR